MTTSDLHKFTPRDDMLVPMAQEMLELYRQNPSRDMIEMIVRLARAWGRYDVWRCVFETEKEAYQAILTDEIYNGAATNAKRYTKVRQDAPQASAAMMETIQMHPHAWKYPEIYSEVFQHYGIDCFSTYRAFDSPMEANISMENHKVPVLINRVWNEGEDGMFFTGIYADCARDCEPDEWGHSPLQMFLAEHLILPDAYQAHQASAKE